MKQCAQPWCGDACRICYLCRRKSGARIVDKEKCIACGACTKACPMALTKNRPRRKLLPQSVLTVVPVYKGA